MTLARMGPSSQTSGSPRRWRRGLVIAQWPGGARTDGRYVFSTRFDTRVASGATRSPGMKYRGPGACQVVRNSMRTPRCASRSAGRRPSSSPTKAREWLKEANSRKEEERALAVGRQREDRVRVERRVHRRVTASAELLSSGGAGLYRASWRSNVDTTGTPSRSVLRMTQ